MINFTLSKQQTGLLLIDVQDRMLAAMDPNHPILPALLRIVRGFQILGLPILVSEQYPQGLGQTVTLLQNVLGTDYKPLVKSTFSCVDDSNFSNQLLQLPVQQWVLVGIEAHICVLQTAKGLLKLDKQVTVLNDAISSRSIYDFSTAIAEMRDCSIRISSSETVLFELVHDSQAPEFKMISEIIKARSQCGSCSC